ncbi:hypothetical protein BH23BAC3_BH23BAC3_35120 [soil metagenome]
MTLDIAFIKCDVSDPDSINNLVEKTMNRYGQIDVLIILTPASQLLLRLMT